MHLLKFRPTFGGTLFNIVGKRGEMPLAAVDLQVFPFPHVHVQIGRALGLQDEIQLAGAVFFQQNGPVRIVVPDGRFHLEFGRYLEKELDLVIPVQRFGEGTLNRGAVIHNVVVNAVVGGDGVAVEICNQLRTVENLLNVIFFSGQSFVTNPVNGQFVSDVP